MPEGVTHSSGYVADVPYPRSFVASIAPSTLSLVAALNGHPTPPDDDLCYGELGSASGDTLTTLAASNPRGRFVGVELSASMVAVARERARQGGVGNVRFVESDFAALAQGADDLPPFDVLVAHGIWSWVSEETRAAALSLVRTHLKPGGLFYVSYNALPGWSAVAPMRRVMRDATRGVSGSLERARAGVDLAQRLLDSGAAYFASHPTARSMLALVQKAGLPYAVHEYFHDDWEPFHFADVVSELAPYGLTFLGQVPLHGNVRELAIPPSLKKMAETVKDRVTLEGLKDFATNEMFRSDVYVKGKLSRAVSETRYFFEGTPFGTLAPLAAVRREAKLPFYTVDYRDSVYERILAVISETRATAMELALRPELAEVGQLRIGEALQSLVLGAQVVPMRPLDESAPVAKGAGEYRLPSKYNELVLAEGLAEEGPLVLACPATRAGLHLSILEGLALRLVTTPGLAPEGYADKVREYAKGRPMPLVVGERRIKDDGELVKVMAREVERFRAASLPKLVELEVVHRA